MILISLLVKNLGSIRDYFSIKWTIRHGMSGLDSLVGEMDENAIDDSILIRKDQILSWHQDVFRRTMVELLLVNREMQNMRAFGISIQPVVFLKGSF
jgi:hypothetical protein